MAGLGRRTFQAGEVLTASNVMAYLQDQVVQNFAGTAARGSAIGTAVSEGMVSYLADNNAVELYDGAAWKQVYPAKASFTNSTTITATNASWSVPSLAIPIVRVTVIGGGGGGGGTGATDGGTGGTTTFNAGGAGSITAAGGLGGARSTSPGSGNIGTLGNSAGNGGGQAPTGGAPGNGGYITVAYLNLTGITTVNVTIGAGGTAGATGGGAGGRGEVIVEYVAP